MVSPIQALNRDMRVVDGDTFELEGRKIRLFGIDAPEGAQSCERQGRAWDCGVWSAQVLADALTRGAVACTEQDQDRYGRSVAICTVAGRDLGQIMVEAGAATAYRRYSMRYVPAEERAKAAGRGIWEGRMQQPEAFRHPDPLAAAPAAASGCVIKGNIGASGRIYHMPGQHDYAATRISPEKGEAWFCSESEARAAGFRPARR